MYGTTDKIELKESNSFNPGINQNVTIRGQFRSPRKDNSGDPVLCIDIEGPTGQKLTVTEWAQDTEDKMKNQLVRLRRWVKEVTGTDTFPTQFASYEDMASKFTAAVNNKDTLLEIKLVYGSKGYLEMPKYDGCVRAMSNPTRLVLSSSEAAKTTKPTATPTDTSMMEGMDISTTDELPF
jgi:hypothetical protein